MFVLLPHAIRQTSRSRFDCNLRTFNASRTPADPTQQKNPPPGRNGHMYQLRARARRTHQGSRRTTQFPRSTPSRRYHGIASRISTPPNKLNNGFRRLHTNTPMSSSATGRHQGASTGSSRVLPAEPQDRRPRSEYQIRVPMDDTHTYHICSRSTARRPCGQRSPDRMFIPYYCAPMSMQMVSHPRLPAGSRTLWCGRHNADRRPLAGVASAALGPSHRWRCAALSTSRISASSRQGTGTTFGRSPADMSYGRSSMPPPIRSPKDCCGIPSAALPKGFGTER